MFLPCMAYCSTAGYGWSGQAIFRLPMIKAWFLSVLVSLLLVGTAAGQRPSLQDPALYAAAAHGAKPLPKAAKRVPYKLHPGVAVFGWFPHWLPDSTYGHYDYSLLSHVAYYGYQATNQGGLLSPTGNPTGLVQAAHQGKAGCKVLLSISYREPATGTTLFDTARTAQRQVLAQAIVAQVAETKADGVNLDFSFSRRAAAPKRPSPPEAARIKAALKGQSVALVQTREQIRADSIRLFNVAQQHDLAQFAKQPEAAPAAVERGKAAEKQLAAEKQQAEAATKNQKLLDQKLATQVTKLKKRAGAYQKKLALYHTKLAEFEKRMAPPPAVLQDFVENLVQVLRLKNPDYVLTLTVPAVDSAAAYTRLTDLAPLVQLFVLKAYDYTATRLLVPGPVSPLRTQNTWGQSSIESSLRYYVQGGVQPTQLLVTFAQVGKVWADIPTQPQPRTGRKLLPSPFRYVANQVWQTWPIVSRLRDKASGSVYVQFGTNPDSTVAGRPSAPQAAWVDDTESLAAKYRWVKEQGLGGIGIWALGYEADSMMTRPFIKAGLVLAPAVIKDFSKPRDTQKATHALPPGPLEKINPILNIVLFVVALLLGFALIGFGIGATLQMRCIAPYRTRLQRAGMLFGTGLLLFGTYLLLLFGPSIDSIYPWGIALLILVVIYLIYSGLRPARTLP